MSFTRKRWLRVLIALVLLASSYLGVVRFMPGGGHPSDALFLLCLVVLVVSAIVSLVSAIWWPVVLISNHEFIHLKALGIMAVVVLVPLFFVFLHALQVGEVRRPRVVRVKNELLEAYIEKLAGATFTNRYPQDCRVFDYTNVHQIAGTNYQCALAADAWDYQGATNLLAITTNRLFLYIDKNGVIVANQIPGY